MSGALLGVLVAVGTLMIGAGFAVGGNATASVGFLAARICFAVGFTILAGALVYWIWMSGLSVTQRTLRLVVIGAVSLGGLSLCIAWVDNLEIERLPRLFAGTDPDPPLPEYCQTLPDGSPFPDDALKIFMGSNLAFSTQFPHTVLKMGGTRMLTIDRDSRGNAMITLLRIFDEQGTILVRFHRGDIWWSEGVRPDKPDKSTLIVYGRADQEVLRVKYLNPQSIRIAGVFRYKNMPAPPVIINEELITRGGSTFKNSCFGENKVDLIF